MTKNLTITQKALSIGTALVLAGSLTACASNTKQSETSQPVTQTQTISSESSTAFSIDPSSSAVENAISIMIDEAEIIADATEETKNSEVYQEAKEESIENFITLAEFLRGEKDINGYYVDDVEQSVVEYAEGAMVTIDGDLERVWPNYKEELKEKGLELLDYLEEKGTDWAAKGYDKYQELKEKTLEKARRNK